jgi:hypothetical protein
MTVRQRLPAHVIPVRPVTDFGPLEEEENGGCHAYARVSMLRCGRAHGYASVAMAPGHPRPGSEFSRERESIHPAAFLDPRCAG